jgi:hypothetical protein
LCSSDRAHPRPLPRRLHLALEFAPSLRLRLRHPGRLRLGAGHARHLLRLGPAELPRGDRFAQCGQAVEVIGQPLELPGAVLAEAEGLRRVEVEAGVTQLAKEPAPLHLGEPEHGAFLGPIAHGEGLAQRFIDTRGRLAGFVDGQGEGGHGAAFRGGLGWEE